MLDLKPKKYTIQHNGKVVMKDNFDNIWKHLLTEFGDMPILKIIKDMEIEYDN